MRPKFLTATFVLTTFITITACNSSSDNKTSGITPDNSAAKTDTSASTASAGDEKAGVGKFKHVDLTHPLDQKMVATGKGVYDVKCGSCHKLTEEKLVGPGWKDVTKRRAPEWIMNFVTNTEEMLQKDATAKNLYEVCLVKMPNQNLTDEDARGVLEFMRNNDGEK
jgi:cytochrome c551/c552